MLGGYSEFRLQRKVRPHSVGSVAVPALPPPADAAVVVLIDGASGGSGRRAGQLVVLML